MNDDGENDDPGGHVVAGRLLALPAGPVSAAEALSGAQQEQIEAVVREYILKNPEILVESLRGYEEKHRQATEEDAKKAMPPIATRWKKIQPHPVAGNPQGDVTIVEFFDYRCGYCKKVLPSIQELLKTDKNVRVVFKEFPILGPDSVIAAQAALAAWKIAPDKYLPFHLALMEIARGNERSACAGDREEGRPRSGEAEGREGGSGDQGDDRANSRAGASVAGQRHAGVHRRQSARAGRRRHNDLARDGRAARAG